MPQPNTTMDPGELTPGQSGWLPLDAAGYPSGPATLNPPSGPNALACSVMCDANGVLVSTTGAELVPPLNSNVDRRYPNDPANPSPPVLLSLEPDSAGILDPDFTLAVVGSAGGTPFTAASVIVFNGGDEVTTFVSPTELTTLVKPSLVSQAIDVPVKVRDAYGESNELVFSFTEAPAAMYEGGRKRDERNRR